MKIDYNEILQQIILDLKNIKYKGDVANYIPELKNVDPNKFGISLQFLNKRGYNSGDFNIKFSIQSISKVFALAMAFEESGNKIWHRVGVEPSGTSFNSLLQLEYENGIPRNPFMNAGALVVCDILIDLLPDPKKDFLKFVQKLAGNIHIQYNKNVAHSESEVGYRNASLAYLLKDFGNIKNPVDKVLDFYFHICSIEMTCEELSKSFLVFANHGINPHNKEKILSESKTKRLNALMQSCGFYDESGEFTFTVGLPGKSGVGGGIAAIFPGEFAISVWSPRLNKKGNSILGMKALELFTTISGKSVF